MVASMSELGTELGERSPLEEGVCDGGGIPDEAREGPVDSEGREEDNEDPTLEINT